MFKIQALLSAYTMSNIPTPTLILYKHSEIFDPSEKAASGSPTSFCSIYKKLVKKKRTFCLS